MKVLLILAIIGYVLYKAEKKAWLHLQSMQDKQKWKEYWRREWDDEWDDLNNNDPVYSPSYAGCAANIYTDDDD